MPILDRNSALTIPQVLQEQAVRLGARHIAIREKAYGIWQAYTWEDYFNYVKRTALGMSAIGISRRETVALVTDNHGEWLFSEVASHALGCSSLNLFTSSIPEELEFSIDRIQASCAVVQDQEQVDKLLEIKDRLPHVKRVVYIDPTGMNSYRSNPWLISYADLLAIGMEEEQAHPKKFDEEVAKGNAKDTAVMIQTSGTTGVSKVAMLSHGGLVAMGRCWTEALDIKPGENWLSMSPPAWIVDQMWGLGVAPVSGITMNFPETNQTVLEDFREIGPSIAITSSRFWEDMASRIRVKVADAGMIKKRLFQVAEKIGRTTIALRDKEQKPAIHWNVLHRLAAHIIYRPLLDRVGVSRMRCALTGGHPISPYVIHFFHAVGLNLKQCYGLTEAGGIFQAQPDQEVKVETVGKPLPGIQVRISSEQEVLVKSDALFSGYYRDYQATESAFEDSWLKTGDAGYIDKDDHLVIIGRKEDIIRDKKGNAFSPDFIETRMKFSPYIKEAVIFGEGRPHITALINIDMENVGSWAEERLIPYTTYMDLSQQEPIEQMIHEEIKNVNKQLPDVMKIHKFILLYKLLDADDEELTRTGKVRRRFVYGVYINLIEAMYRNIKELDVKGKIRYRDGRIGEITTRVRVIDVDLGGS
ncbi:MAG: Long-chain acyl-CoA synthetase [Syntrophus sp. SKADARSKE-3]|nr:Long-chain acyl-CoA synthetase [Syntrophus sp. SKADARSKE-3]